MSLLQYKGYYGSVGVSIEAGCLFGKLEFIEPLVNYEGQSVSQLEQAFREAVDSYLETCEQLGYEVIKPCKGSFNVRIGSELHRHALIMAKKKGVNLNEFVKQSIEQSVKC